MTTSSAANTRDRDTDVLARFDDERGAGGEPSPRGDLVRECSPDGSECRVVYSSCPVERIEDIIRDEKLRAESCHYTLEWKVYAHDTPSSLRSYLLCAGFEPDAVESVLVLSVTQEAVAAFEAPDVDIRRIYDVEGLSDVAAISRQIGRQDVEEEKQRLAALLRDTPEELSVHVAYVDGEPVACGRTHFKPNSDFAELAGGRTKTTHRNRGLFTDWSLRACERHSPGIARTCSSTLCPRPSPSSGSEGSSSSRVRSPSCTDPPPTQQRPLESDRDTEVGHASAYRLRESADHLARFVRRELRPWHCRRCPVPVGDQ